MEFKDHLHTDEFEKLDLERQLHVKQLQIESLLEVTKAINNNLRTESLFRIYEFILSSQLGVKEFVLYLFSENIWEQSVLHGFEKDNFADINFSKDILEIKSNKILKTDRRNIPEPFNIVVPVYHKEVALAYIFLGEVTTYDNESIEEKLKFIQAITNIIVVAIENKRLFSNTLEAEKLSKEMELAAKMQISLIPKDLPVNKDVRMAGVYKPHSSIGGDYYDCIRISGGKYLFCIADISGKGAAAALLMANFQAVLRTLVIEKADLKHFIIALNKRVIEITQGEKFITFFVGIYDPITRNLKYINAGHNPSILASNNSITLLEKGCTILGIFDDLPSIEVGEVNIPEHSLLVNYTDGLTDTLNEQDHFFDSEKLTYFIKENKNLAVNKFNRDLIDFVELFKGSQQYADDISILTCRFI